MKNNTENHTITQVVLLSIINNTISDTISQYKFGSCIKVLKTS